MTERWRHQLGKLDEVEPSHGLLERAHGGSRHHDQEPSTGHRMFIIAVAFLVAVAGMSGAFFAFRGAHGGAVRPGDTRTSEMFFGLWPERTLADAEAVQAKADQVAPGQDWRADPKEVAKRFVIEVMGWQANYGTDFPALNVDDVRRGPDGSFTVTISRAAHSWPYPGPPWWMEWANEQITMRQLVHGGSGGIWSVVEVRSNAIAVPYDPGAALGGGQMPEGQVTPPGGEPAIPLGGSTDGGCPLPGAVVADMQPIVSPDGGGFAERSATAEAALLRVPGCGSSGAGRVEAIIHAFKSISSSANGVPTQGSVVEDPLSSGVGRDYVYAMAAVPVSFANSLPSERPPVPAAEAPFFPTMTSGYATGNQAASVGTLHEQDGCVVVGDGPRADVPIWPAGFSLRHNNDGSFAVLDADGRQFAASGERVVLGGNHAQARPDTSAWIESRIGQPIPDACTGGGFWLMSSGGGGEEEGSVFHVTCDGTGTAVEDTFATSGSHGWIFEVSNTTDGPLRLAVDRAANYLGPVGPGVTKLGYIDAPPGGLRIACSDSAGGFSRWAGLHTASVFGLYTSPDLQCGPGSSAKITIPQYGGDARGETGDLLKLARKDLSGLEPADEVRFSGYEAEPDQPIVVKRDGKRVASITYDSAPSGPGWIISEVRVCDGSGII